jgi:coenzyme PQQ precursor peptide PqqA
LPPYSKRFSQRRLPVNKDEKETTMAWTTPTLVEICIGLEINGYLPAEF